MEQKLSKLFYNNAMARVLDVILENKDSKSITIAEIVETTGLSRRSVGDSLKLLKDMDMLSLEVKHLNKLYKVNKKDKLTKYLINVRDMLDIG